MKTVLEVLAFQLNLGSSWGIFPIKVERGNCHSMTLIKQIRFLHWNIDTAYCSIAWQFASILSIFSMLFRISAILKLLQVCGNDFENNLILVAAITFHIYRLILICSVFPCLVTFQVFPDVLCHAFKNMENLGRKEKIRKFLNLC